MFARFDVAVEQLLECCRRVETSMAATYWFLAELHAGTPETAALWRKTAGEEENHARQFEFSLKFPGLLADPVVKAEDMNRWLKEVLDQGAAVRAAKPVAADALRMCIDLERRLADYHMKLIYSRCDEIPCDFPGKFEGPSSITRIDQRAARLS